MLSSYYVSFPSLSAEEPINTDFLQSALWSLQINPDFSQTASEMMYWSWCPTWMSLQSPCNIHLTKASQTAALTTWCIVLESLFVLRSK